MITRRSARRAVLALAFACCALPTAAFAQRLQDAPRPAVSAAAGLPAPSAAAHATTKQAPVTTVTLSPALLQQLQQQAEQQQLAEKPPLAQRLPVLTHLFAGIFVIAAVALVVLLAFQTTKQEGLSGTIGGRVEANYRPRLGFDQQLQRLTSFVAIAFVVFATILSISGI